MLTRKRQNVSYTLPLELPPRIYFMTRRSWRYCTLCFLIGVGGVAATRARATEPGPIRVGMVQTFFNDVPRVLVEVATDPFAIVIREATGLNGHLIVGGDAFDVAKQLHEGQMDLAVFHSFEFAWARQKHPELKPLMIAVNKHHQVQAFLLTRKDNPAAGFADLRGKDIALPRRSKEYCRLFVKQRSYDLGQCAPAQFFHEVVASSDTETALDDLCTGKVQAAVVDSLGMEFYRDLKPGCFARFKVVQASELFPPAVIAYKDGAVNDATLRRVREVLMSASSSLLGREMMKLWKIHSFDAVSEEYTPSLVSILKAYPTPEPTAKVSRR
jgi:ABC-type phosphate/phosphonate transport system substrate-binding protein